MANAMGMDNAATSMVGSAGQNFIATVLAKMPWTYKIIEDITTLNPRYEVFRQLTSSKEERIQTQSVLQATAGGDVGGSIMINKDYHQFMYANVDVDKVRRLQDYRKMAAYAEMAIVLDEICDEVFVKDKGGNIVNFDMKSSHDRVVKDEIIKEWKKFITIFDLANTGWEICRNFLVDGEMFFENIISRNRPDMGILGILSIPTELINPIYDNVQNMLIQGFLLRKPVTGPKRTISKQNQEELITMEGKQVTYVHSGIWNEDRTIRLPYIENSRRAYKQLSLIEDSIVIYRLVRAPERLIFRVDVGNMPSGKAEAYLRKVMQQYWSRKNYDRGQGRTTNVYDPQSQLDSYFFAKRTGNEGTTVDTLQGGQNLGQLDDLMYFKKKLYESLRVPVSRLEPGDAFKDGTEITREELKFARFIMRIQSQIAEGIRRSFITHLKLRGLWDTYKIREHNVYVEFNTPTNFMVMRDQQIFDLKFQNYNNMATNEGVSYSYAQRYFLDMSDEEMAENREWMKKDAAAQWELDQIRTLGPDFRDQQNAMDAAMDEMGTPGGAGAGGFVPTTPPEFGPGPAGAEGEVPGAEGVAPTPAPAAGAPAGSALPGNPPQ